MARVAITGATGHLGSSLIRQLIARGDEVRALVREPGAPEPLQGLPIELVRGDLITGDGLDTLLDGVEVVYHLAAQISIVGPMNGLVDAVNVGGVRNVVAAARRAQVRRMVHTCSVHVFEPEPFDVPTDETRPRVRRGHAPAYDVSKADGEVIVRDAVADGFDAVIVHPSAVMGPFDFRPSRMGHVLIKLYRRRLPGMFDGGFDFVDARDVSAGMIAAAERGRAGESYILTGHYRHLRDFAKMAAAITGVAAPRLEAPVWLANLGAPFMDVAARVLQGEPLYTSESLMPLRLRCAYDHGKAARELGYSIRPLEDTLRDAYAWMLARGVLTPKTESTHALTHHAVTAT
ncbi:MAG: NAD-dependent epimerase/dehydratase family protein [Deltaproteobacteria bacterium]|nr:NAD-dependent epimerase/dehydratase family protein [Deltaproteobacteria bacterium]